MSLDTTSASACILFCSKVYLMFPPIPISAKYVAPTDFHKSSSGDKLRRVSYFLLRKYMHCGARINAHLLADTTWSKTLPHTFEETRSASYFIASRWHSLPPWRTMLCRVVGVQGRSTQAALPIAIFFSRLFCLLHSEQNIPPSDISNQGKSVHRFGSTPLFRCLAAVVFAFPFSGLHVHVYIMQ